MLPEYLHFTHFFVVVVEMIWAEYQSKKKIRLFFFHSPPFCKMTVKSPAKRSKRARKFDKKNKVPVEKPRQPLPKAVFTRMEPAAEYSNFEHDDLVEKIEFERPEGHYIRFTGNKQRQSPFIFTFSYLSICLWFFFFFVIL